MKNTIALVALSLMTGAAFANGPRFLTGRVFVGANPARPAVGFWVTRDGKDPTKTVDQGVFSIPLPDNRGPGKRIKLDVTTPGYCILFPPGGEVVMPDDLGEEKAVELRLLRSGSNPTRDCIANFIAETASKAARTAAKKEGRAGGRGGGQPLAPRVGGEASPQRRTSTGRGRPLGGRGEVAARRGPLSARVGRVCGKEVR